MVSQKKKLLLGRLDTLLGLIGLRMSKSKFRYNIVPDQTYSLDFGNGKVIEDSGRNLLTILSEHYSSEFWFNSLETEGKSPDTDSSSENTL
jgi:hypothetical protein